MFFTVNYAVIVKEVRPETGKKHWISEKKQEGGGRSSGPLDICFANLCLELSFILSV